MARKSESEIMWEVFVESSNGGPVTTGGPLKAGGGSSTPKSSDDEDVDGDPYEDEEGEDELQDILNKCHSGDMTAEEAHEHITKLMKGDDEDEEKNVKRGTAQKATEEMRGQFTKGKSDANVRRPQPRRDVEDVKRDTTHYQKGM